MLDVLKERQPGAAGMRFPAAVAAADKLDDLVHLRQTVGATQHARGTPECVLWQPARAAGTVLGFGLEDRSPDAPAKLPRPTALSTQLYGLTQLSKLQLAVRSVSFNVWDFNEKLPLAPLAGSLRHLSLTNCNVRRLPGIHRLVWLTKLQVLSNHLSLLQSPEIMLAALTALTALKEAVFAVARLPPAVAQLTSLESLSLRGRNIRTGDLQPLTQLRNLRMLQLGYCNGDLDAALPEVRGMFGRLEVLWVDGFLSQPLPPLQCLTSIVYLRLDVHGLDLDCVSQQTIGLLTRFMSLSLKCCGGLGATPAPKLQLLCECIAVVIRSLRVLCFGNEQWRASSPNRPPVLSATEYKAQIRAVCAPCAANRYRPQLLFDMSTAPYADAFHEE